MTILVQWHHSQYRFYTSVEHSILVLNRISSAYWCRRTPAMASPPRQREGKCVGRRRCGVCRRVCGTSIHLCPYWSGCLSQSVNKCLANEYIDIATTKTARIDLPICFPIKSAMFSQTVYSRRDSSLQAAAACTHNYTNNTLIERWIVRYNRRWKLQETPERWGKVCFQKWWERINTTKSEQLNFRARVRWQSLQ